MANTIGISGTLTRKVGNTTKLTVAISPSVSYTEYTEAEITVAAGGSNSINLGGLTEPDFLYVDTDEAITIKFFRGADAVASALPVNSALLITGNATYRFGTVTVSNPGATEAQVKIYMA